MCKLNLLLAIPTEILHRQGKFHLKSTRAYYGGGGVAFLLSLETRDILIKSANLLHHWFLLEPLTLMEETTYQKLIHFTSIGHVCLFFVFEIKGATLLNT